MTSLTLNIGDIVASRESAILGTILGSCVSVCLFDEEAGIGGMNHFLLPDVINDIGNPLYCAPNSITRLVDEVLGMGAHARNVRAKVFGGGRVSHAFADSFDIGRRNVRTAKDILSHYEIPIVREFTCPDFGIKLIFHTGTGRAFVKQICNEDLLTWRDKSAVPCPGFGLHLVENC